VIESRRFAKPKLFSTRIIKRTLPARAWKSGPPAGQSEHCVDCVRGFINAGVDHVTIRPIGQDLNKQFRIYLEEVLPGLNLVAGNAA